MVRFDCRSRFLVRRKTIRKFFMAIDQAYLEKEEGKNMDTG